MTLQWATLSTPVGPISVGCGQAGVASVRFGPPPPGGGTRAGGAKALGSAPLGRDDGAAGELAEIAHRQLAEYFCGRRRQFDLPLDWSVFSTAQHKVLRRLYDEVGYGQTVTYGGLAGLAGITAAGDVVPARAVGTIMGSNPLPVIVPCHRVVASDGLGGFSGGTGPEAKRWLLILEGSQPPTLDWVPAAAAPAEGSSG
ncbi:MAG TPA: methylated-DNA--[protein]-cysteine S-methyltransferase [Streptosporangiaceae bacterium]|jgi:methylated-DNA-[protein]-cysteine S-methyltransferase